MEINWIETVKELPPRAGDYEITNHPEYVEDSIQREQTGIAYYDGYGFQYLGIYREPAYWRKFPERTEKRYGKIL